MIQDIFGTPITDDPPRADLILPSGITPVPPDASCELHSEDGAQCYRLASHRVILNAVDGFSIRVCMRHSLLYPPDQLSPL